MGGKARGTLGALFSHTRQRVLEVVLSDSPHAFAENTIVRLAGVGVSGTRRELDSLARVGIVRCERVGRQKQYRPNEASELLAPLRAIVFHSQAVFTTLRTTLEPHNSVISGAYVTGPWARGEAIFETPISLWVVSDVLEWDDVYELLEPARPRLPASLHLEVRCIESYLLLADHDGRRNLLGNLP